jgi:hypothetical protein
MRREDKRGESKGVEWRGKVERKKRVSAQRRYSPRNPLKSRRLEETRKGEDGGGDDETTQGIFPNSRLPAPAPPIAC